MKKFSLALFSCCSSEQGGKKAQWKEFTGQIDQELFSCSDSTEISLWIMLTS